MQLIRSSAKNRKTQKVKPLSDRWVSYFLRLAEQTANMSYAERLKVGCVAVLDKRPILTGFNGTPPGEANICECSKTNCTLPNVSHAEENLILFAARKGIALEGTSLFLTHSPCDTCARLILGAGIKDVYFLQYFRATSGLQFLLQNGLTIWKATSINAPQVIKLASSTLPTQTPVN